MKKAIIQLKDDRKIINIPEHIYLIARLADSIAKYDVTNVPDIFDEAMDYLNNYYSEIGTTLFVAENLFVREFLVPEDKDIVDHCVLDNSIDFIIGVN